MFTPATRAKEISPSTGFSQVQKKIRLKPRAADYSSRILSVNTPYRRNRRVQVLGHLVDGFHAIDAPQQPLFSVILKNRLGLRVVSPQTRARGFRLVVGAPYEGGAAAHVANAVHLR